MPIYVPFIMYGDRLFIMVYKNYNDYKTQELSSAFALPH